MCGIAPLSLSSCGLFSLPLTCVKPSGLPYVSYLFPSLHLLSLNSFLSYILNIITETYPTRHLLRRASKGEWRVLRTRFLRNERAFGSTHTPSICWRCPLPVRTTSHSIVAVRNFVQIQIKFKFSNLNSNSNSSAEWSSCVETCGGVSLSES